LIAIILGLSCWALVADIQTSLRQPSGGTPAHVVTNIKVIQIKITLVGFKNLTLTSFFYANQGNFFVRYVPVSPPFFKIIRSEYKNNNHLISLSL
jgi:hypothetical protein